MKKILFFGVFLFSAFFFFKFLTRQAISPTKILTADDKIKKFKSVEELRVFLENNQQTGGYGMGGGRGGAIINDVVPSGLQKLSIPETGGAPRPDYSNTNVQVEGVDEGDIVKTDGKYIYSVSGNNLYIIEATPAESSSILSKIEFKSTPTEIYINGDSLVVYGVNNQIYTEGWYGTEFKRNSPYTFFKVFDVRDHKNPRQVRDLDFEGSIFSSRMIGDYVYLITNYSQNNILDSVPYPRILNNRTGELINRKESNIFYFDYPYDSFNFVSVSAINIKNNNKEVKSSAYLLPQAQNVYVSEKNIFLTYTRYISEQDLAAEVMREIIFPKLSQKEKERISAIENTPNYVLSRQEKMQKISSLMQMYLSFLPEKDAVDLRKQVEVKLKQKYKDLSRELEKTVIHKIAINGENLDYQNFGEVTGSVLNQFSMDESAAGDFRIATTKNQNWSMMGEIADTKSYNNLYVLDKNMQVVGKLEDLAFDERIYSVRFMQGRAYMVTFKQTDPLFVIDVSNPINPKVLGKLKVPGFSQYLHPFDETTLIGFGKETSEAESGGVITEGLKLSLFDVSDVNNLKEIDKVTIGERGANSVALYDHKAFLFSKDKNLLVVPVEIQESDIGKDANPIMDCFDVDCVRPIVPLRNSFFRGAYVYNVTKNGFNLKGKIDHFDGSNGNSYDWWGYGGYDTTVKRSLWIGDVLYTLSDKYLKANKISDLMELKNLKLSKEQNEDFKVIN